MRILSIIALLSLSLPSVAAVRERTPAQLRRELRAYGCPIDGPERLPFPLPSYEASETWGDADYEAWEGVQWARYCEAHEFAHACRCEALRSGGTY